MNAERSSALQTGSTLLFPLFCVGLDARAAATAESVIEARRHEYGTPASPLVFLTPGRLVSGAKARIELRESRAIIAAMENMRACGSARIAEIPAPHDMSVASKHRATRRGDRNACRKFSREIRR